MAKVFGGTGNNPLSVNFKKLGERVRAVRRDLGLDVADLADWAEVSQDALHALEEHGEPLPVCDLVATARALHYDWETLLEPPGDLEEQVLQLFRKNQNLTLTDRLALADFAKRASTLPQLTQDLVPLLAPIKPALQGYQRGNGREVAQKLRERLRLGEAPLVNPFELPRKYGVQLFRVKFSTKALSGVTLMHRSFGAAVVIRIQDDLFRQAFSAMHELGHVLMDREAGAVASYDTSRPDAGIQEAENRANGFAAGMLLPTGMLKENWSTHKRDWSAWRPLLVKYRVNFGTLVQALTDTKLIERPERDELFKNPPVVITRAEKEDFDRLRRSLGNVAWLDALAELGLSPELADAAVSALREERVSWGWAADQLRVDREDLSELLAVPPMNLRPALPTEVNSSFA